MEQEEERENKKINDLLQDIKSIKKLWFFENEKRLEEKWDAIDGLKLKIEEIQKESNTLTNLQIECTNYVKECKKEIDNGLRATLEKSFFMLYKALYNCH
ncbi:MAG: hypothetical protein DBO98_02865 [Candidatus Liberibacter europaeus]|nr:hypothetical protein [Candidatus Liberibacter europaeus]